MPMCRNIEDFDRGCALILARLYAAFPARVPLHADRLEPDPLEATPQRTAVYGASVEFLADEGYLVFAGRAGPEASRAFHGVRLTAKGLAALNRTPETLRPAGRTLGDRLVELAGEGVRETVAALVRAVLG